MALHAVANGTATDEEQAMVDRLLAALDELGWPETVNGRADLAPFAEWAEALYERICNWC